MHMALPENKRKKRLIYLLAGFAVLFGGLLLRVLYLQVFKGAEYQQRALSQWTSDSLVQPKRGTITDRNGEILAQSGTVDTVLLRPKQIASSKLENAAEQVADTLAPILEMDRDEILEKATDTTKSELYLKRQITRDQANQIRAAIEEKNLPGIAFTVDTKRFYPKQNFLTQVLGFTSVDGEGIEGIEAQYNKYLTGEAGKVSTQTDVKGNEVAFADEFYVAAKDGYTVELSIDYTIQSYVEKAAEDAYEKYEAKNVQVIAMDPKTGKILAMTVKPDYDLNEVPRDDAETLTSLSRNRLVADAYEPGSVFKVFTTAAALETGVTDLHKTYVCNGGRTVNGQFIKCWKHHEGTQTIEQGLANSCNPVFMDLALGMGKDKFYEYIYNFGFGSKTGIDFPAESTGIVRNKEDVRDGDLARIGFGQSISVTPLQMVTAFSAVVNGGTLYEPSLVSRILTADGEVVETVEPKVVRENVISAETSKTMCELLENVVAGGSGSKSYVAGYRVGGKTGTAQKYEEDGTVAQNKHITSFMGFAPVDDPKIVVLFLVDEANAISDFGSTVAAPYVGQIIEESLKYMGVEPKYTEEELKQMKAKVEVPNVVGKSKEEAEAALKAKGLKASFKGNGTLIDEQVPSPGTTVESGSEIILYLRAN